MIAPPPPALPFHRPHGTKLVAGLGFAEVIADLDCETYSEAGYVWNPHHMSRGKPSPRWEPPKGVATMKDAGLFAVGAAKYTEHPTFEVLWLSYNLKDGKGTRRWRPGLPFPQDLFDYIAAGGLVESHNCGFEFWVWLNYLHKRLGWPLIPHDQQRCSMAKARKHGLPGQLDALGKVLQITHQKDADGKELMKQFSMPRNPTAADPRTRCRPEDDPVAFERYGRYCDRDIEAEAEASAKIPDLEGDELEWWKIDQLINRRGVQVDLVTVEKAIAIIEAAFERYDAELCVLTDFKVAKASELEKLKAWLETQGVYAPSMDKDALEELMKERHRFPPQAARAIEIRALIGSAAVKKLYAMRNQATEAGRLHELFGYHAARTGRTNGMGPQPTNLPNSGPDVRVCACGRHHGLHLFTCPWCGRTAAPPPPKPLVNRAIKEWDSDAAADAIEIIRTGNLDTLERFFGNAVGAVSACLRGMFVAAEGHDLISSDYTAIEAVVLAELAGEQWRIDLFKAGGKIYEASGAKVEGLDYEAVLKYKADTGNHHPCRKKGKVLELALGFGGWIGALCNFGADEFMTEDEMKTAIVAWREASPAIVEFWGGQFRGLPWAHDRKAEMFGLEGMAISAVMYPGKVFECRGITYQVVNDVLYCTLLSGRRIAYHRPRLRKSSRDTWGESLTLSYETWNSNAQMGPIGWIRVDTYSGKLTENVVQATARDILVFAIINLWRAGYATVLHVYDEIVAEIVKGWGSVEEFEAIMGRLPAWAHDWPVKAAGGWRGFRYRK